ncbi:DNA replication licensing factor MCM7, partial [Coemansia spiralis]
MSALESIRSIVDYEGEVGKISQFLEKFVDSGSKKAAAVGDDDDEAMGGELSPGKPRSKYVELLQRVANRAEDT